MPQPEAACWLAIGAPMPTVWPAPVTSEASYLVCTGLRRHEDGRAVFELWKAVIGGRRPGQHHHGAGAPRHLEPRPLGRGYGTPVTPGQ